MGESTTSRGTRKEIESWRVQLLRACRDGSVEIVESLANANPTAIHEHFCEGLDDWQLEWESLQWYELGEATCLYVAASHCQEDLVRWLLTNGADREKSCYHGLKPLDIVGQCRQDDAASASAAIRLMLTQELSRGATKRMPKRATVSSASCKVSLSWPTYWLSDINSSRDGQLGGGVTYELHYRLREGQNWICVATKTPNKTLTGLNPGEWYDFKVRAVNSLGLGDFSSTTALQTPGEPENGAHSADLAEAI